MKNKIIFITAVIILVLAAVSAAGAQYKTYVTFGHYEQDNNLDNGPEEIEWQVLSKADNWALLVSKYVIDVRPYNDTRADVTWETSSIRKWLNNDFYNNAFSQSEREQIGYFNWKNPDNPKYNTSGGNKTPDRISLLSYEEVISNMPEEKSRQANPTAYAKTKGPRLDDATGTASWTTRTPGSKAWGVVGVEPNGVIYLNGGAVEGKHGIRPCLFIKMDK